MKKDMIKSCSGSILQAAMLMVMGLSSTALAQNSPVGTWDCVINGNRQGTAYFQFQDDGTFNVIEAIVPNAPSTSSSTVGRGGSNVGRSGSTGSTNVFVPTPQIFGEEITNGSWAFDIKGRVIGFFVEVSQQENCTTTPIPYSTNTASSAVPFAATNGLTTDPTYCVITPTATNDLGGGVTNYTETDICYTNVTVCTALTNSISFVGTVVPNKRITLKCMTPFGNTVYRGIPAQTLPDISGPYYAIKTQNGVARQEFFTNTPSAIAPFAPNIYDVELSGPGYTYSGQAILSSRKRISFVLGLTPAIPTNPPVVVRAVTGPFNATKLSANTQGLDEPANSSLGRVHFNVQALP